MAFIRPRKECEVCLRTRVCAVLLERWGVERECSTLIRGGGGGGVVVVVVVSQRTHKPWHTHSAHVFRACSLLFSSMAATSLLTAPQRRNTQLHMPVHNRCLSGECSVSRNASCKKEGPGGGDLHGDGESVESGCASGRNQVCSSVGCFTPPSISSTKERIHGETGRS
ncbi:hypothetical protein FN846DRAFT_209443 [Sphaerosporella brunnea]|uniref:Uncharacterized protein n=1 Tax=Sphaerosporella brunnea TaxID=1250544 RepID=A0A5J5EMQ6_9PEZI|nr:hypothetical protein FN846DRAFT_209443 [Sphaerosporella brunnea]